MPKHFFTTLALASVLFCANLPSAKADLRVCNRTSSTVGLAIGYQLDGEWISEGWWNLEKDECDTVLMGALVSTKFLVHAIDYDKGGKWVGENFMCTKDKQFTIKGVKECVARGFEKTGFYEVDTAGKQDYTVQLTEQK